ncbi:MAG TPA: hypothetical protein GYA10_03235 [Alphaproteobacteria bacterium]|nr:hypothetical protein [Alphaproteobacteria bacterium]
MNRIPLPVALVALVVFAASLAGLAAMTGTLPALAPGPLVGDVRISPLPLPAAVKLDPLVIAEELQQELSERAARDVAVRMAFGPENADQMQNLVIPRLVNAAVIGRMIERIPPLRTVMALGALRASARIAISNTGAAGLTDVALVLPGLAAAETADGTALEVTRTAAGATALRLGALEPGQTLAVTAWLDQPIEALDAARAQFALGAAGGLDGSLVLRLGEGWLGEDLAAYGWARWLIGGLLGLIALLSAVLLGALVVGAVRAREVRPLRPA